MPCKLHPTIIGCLMKSPDELDEEMLAELDEFLMSDDAPEDCLQISELDGFLAGIVVGPELIKPSEWVPCIWMGGEPEFKDMDQAERIMGIIMSRYNEIIYQLKDDPKEYNNIVNDKMILEKCDNLIEVARSRVKEILH